MRIIDLDISVKQSGVSCAVAFMLCKGGGMGGLGCPVNFAYPEGILFVQLYESYIVDLKPRMWYCSLIRVVGTAPAEQMRLLVFEFVRLGNIEYEYFALLPKCM